MKRILLVDDDREICFALEHILLSAGYAVSTADSAAMAHKLLSTSSYDLVLADGKLGDGTGFEIADLAKIQGAKALIITGCGMEFSGDELERHPYLIKPVRPIEIVKAIERLIASA